MKFAFIIQFSEFLAAGGWEEMFSFIAEQPTASEAPLKRAQTNLNPEMFL